MKLIDRQFWIAWTMLLLLMIGCCLTEDSCIEDLLLLGGAYAMSLISTWFFHKLRPRAAFGNLTVMIVCNSILALNLVFNSRHGEGFTWWLYTLLFNTALSTALLITALIIRLRGFLSTESQ